MSVGVDKHDMNFMYDLSDLYDITHLLRCLTCIIHFYEVFTIRQSIILRQLKYSNQSFQQLHPKYTDQFSLLCISI
mgnify:CR=1 FL=1